jgi:hypothetical protein
MTPFVFLHDPVCLPPVGRAVRALLTPPRGAEKGSGFGVWGLGFGVKSVFILNPGFGSPNQAFTSRIFLRMTDGFFPFLRLLSEKPKARLTPSEAKKDDMEGIVRGD